MSPHSRGIIAKAALIQPSYCYVTRADACFCSAVGVIGPTGVLEATVVDTRSGGGVTVAMARVSVLHGDTGGIAAGQVVTAYAAAAVNDTLIIPVAAHAPMTEHGWGVHRVHSDGTLAASCRYPVAPLTEEQAIEAMLIQPRPQGYRAACGEYLKHLHSEYGKSVCDSSGCGVTARGSTGSPLVLGAALAVAAVWRLRRRRRA